MWTWYLPVFRRPKIRKAIYKEAPADGFWYPAVSEAGQKLKQGALLGTLKDPLWK